MSEKKFDEWLSTLDLDFWGTTLQRKGVDNVRILDTQYTELAGALMPGKARHLAQSR